LPDLGEGFDNFVTAPIIVFLHKNKKINFIEFKKIKK